MLSAAIALYTDMITQVIPYVTAFCIGNLIVRSVLNAAFKGRMSFD